METRTVEQVENWKSRPFTDGYPGLRELSDGEFSGAVRAGGAWLFMLNGRVIGVHEGSLDDFEDADGTAYAAPHPSLPLLFSMQAEGGETRAKYYTNDTPLSEADSTLTDGGFTGYVELSENVLSGDYYVAYYGGRSMSVAFAGASEQVISGDEAFERAADEVGIYEVRDVDLEVIDLPEPEDADDAEESPAPAETDSSADASGTVEPADSPATDPPAETGGESAPSTGRSAADETPGAAGSGPTPGVTESEPTEAEPTEAEPTETEPAETERVETEPAETKPTDAETPAPEGVADPVTTDASAEAGDNADIDPHTTDSARQRPTTTAETVTESPKNAGVTEESTATETTTEAVAETDAAPERSDAADEQATGDEGMFDDEEEWREATTIPSLDPDRTQDSEPAESPKSEQASASTPGSTSAERAERAKSQSKPSAEPSGRSSPENAPQSSGQSRPDGQARPDDRSKTTARPERRDRTAEASTTGESSGGKAAAEANAQLERLQSQLDQRGQQVEQLESRLSKVQSERDELKRERDALRQEVERLEAELEAAADAGDAAGAGRRLDRAQAFDGTNLFVRYRSKGDATLDEAAAGDVDPEDVNANLRLEHHTQFEADDVAVEGAPFDEFLADSFEYRFASWVVEDLLYEIRDTGHRGHLRDLYEAIPQIDRVDLHGSVSAGGDDEDTRQEAFDVIMRDRMGNPLFVADLNGSRDPTTGEMMGSLVDAATGVAEAHDELAGAFQVTESFFEPEALETTESATSGGLLSREKRESFVKLSRKRGYHLCLVESRSGGFHLNVPEL